MYYTLPVVWSVAVYTIFFVYTVFTDTSNDANWVINILYTSELCGECYTLHICLHFTPHHLLHTYIEKMKKLPKKVHFGETNDAAVIWRAFCFGESEKDFASSSYYLFILHLVCLNLSTYIWIIIYCAMYMMYMILYSISIKKTAVKPVLRNGLTPGVLICFASCEKIFKIS